jgi:phosphatidylglycerol:prolipoprotein diacylglycerol transferase
VHRVLVRIPTPFGHPLEVAAYGTMVALGALVAIYIACVRAKRAGVNPTVMLDLALVLIVSGLLGARLFYFIFDDWSEFAGAGVWGALKKFVNFPSGGLSFYGAVAFATSAGLIFLRRRMKNVWLGADIAMPSVALGIAFARIGCYLNGCCFGKPCAASFPLAQEFPADSIPKDYYFELEHARHYFAHGVPQWPITIYPTQIISSLNAFVLFVVLSLVFSRRRFDGQVFCLFGVWYGISRFLIEFLRADNDLTIFGALTTWQLAGLLLSAASAALWVVLARRARRALA